MQDLNDQLRQAVVPLEVAEKGLTAKEKKLLQYEGQFAVSVFGTMVKVSRKRRDAVADKRRQDRKRQKAGRKKSRG